MYCRLYHGLDYGIEELGARREVDMTAFTVEFTAEATVESTKACTVDPAAQSNAKSVFYPL